MHRQKKVMKSIFLLFLIPAVCWAFPGVTKIGDATVDSQAMTLGSGAPYGYAINGLSFQQNPLITFNGWQYITYYNGDRHVCVGRRQLPSGSWAVIELTDYILSTTTDAHNVVTMGICPNDGTIHLSFDHHGGTLHYRVSDTGVATNPGSVTWNASLFNSVRNYLIIGQTISSVTYPRFWQTPAGDLQFGYRAGGSGSGDWYMADYTAATGLWSNNRQIINRNGSYSDSLGSSSTRNAYMNPPGYGPDGKLHTTWTWRESAGGANHDIMYAWSDDGGVTWYNNNLPSGFQIGTGNTVVQSMFSLSWGQSGLEVIGNTSTGLLIRVDSPDVTVVTLDRYYGMMNQQAQAIDSEGRVHVVMFHCTPETYLGYPYSTWGSIGARRYYHYWRDAQGAWNRNELPFNSMDVSSYVGSRPKIFIRSNGDAYVIYQSWQSAGLNDTGIYIHDGDLVIEAATAANQWADWQIIHVESGDFLGEALADPYRFQDGILSVMMQDSPSSNGNPTPLRVLDFQLNE